MPPTASRVDPLLGFRFRVRCTGEPLGGFTEVSGIAAEIETTDVVEGGQNDFVHKLPGRVRQGDVVSLRRGLATVELWRWFAALARGENDRRVTVVEILHPDRDEPALRWVLQAAFPRRWSGPELKGDQSLVAVESVDLCHHGFTVEEGSA